MFWWKNCLSTESVVVEATFSTFFSENLNQFVFYFKKIFVHEKKQSLCCSGKLVGFSVSP